MSTVKVIAEILRITELADEKVNGKTFTYLSGFTCIDTMPADLLLMEDVVKEYLLGSKYRGTETVIVSAKVGDLWSDPTYNRPDRISYTACVSHIEKTGGFSFHASDNLSAFLRPDGKVCLTKGNHRATMRYLICQDPNVRVPVSLKLHKRDATIDHMILVESKDHTRDCSYRTGQSGDDKFKSNYYAEEAWAVELFNFCAKFMIGIAGTNPDAKFKLPSYSYLDRARKKIGAVYAEKFLTAFTEQECATTIGGNIIIAGTSFCKYFSETIAAVDAKYGVDSLADTLQFYFHKWGELMAQIDEPVVNVTQEMITDSTAWNNPPGQEPGIARLVFLYNAYCKRMGYSLKNSAKTVICFESPSKKSEWNVFLESCHEFIRPGIYGVAKTKFF